jgi:alpha-galactosidase
VIILKSKQNSIVFETDNKRLSIFHWGSLLHDVEAGLDFRKATTRPVSHAHWDEPTTADVMREHSRGFIGHPTIEGHRDGKAWSTHFELVGESHTSNSLTAQLVDSHAKLTLTLAYHLSEDGVLSMSGSLTNNGTSDYVLNEYIHWLPLADHATDVMDFTGRWSHERHPQRREIAYGLTSREVREGRSSHDYTIAQLALTRNANFNSGDVWSISMAFSGNSVHHVEKTQFGDQSIGAGELFLPGEIIIKPNESFAISPVQASFTEHGIDGISDNFYKTIRKRRNHPTSIRPRPLTLNVWEAVYFNHDIQKIKALADIAAEIGVERMVLDDGWFHLRRNDHAGLGDWVIDPAVWPEGFTEIIEYLNTRGIEFGLWFEGEMVQIDSDLYRAHPEWILQEGGRIPPQQRRQLVLDLTHQGAYDHVLGQVDHVLSTYKIAYIKWDHNRILNDAGHLGQAAVHNQTLAIYRLFDELKRRHPGLEIESCASGGARIDLGMVEHVDRFWTSDNNDALERQIIQRWTSLVIPPEMLGTHIGPTHGHQTGKTTELSFRAINALFGHAGIEWDVTEASPDQITTLKSWATLYKSKRSLLHSGKSVRIDYPDAHAFAYGVVAEDQSEALFAYMQHLMPSSNFAPKLRFNGLDKSAIYRVSIVREVGSPLTLQRSETLWDEGVLLSGSALEKIGIQPPSLAPENGILISLVRA